MGKTLNGQRRLSSSLEKKVEKYYNETQKLKLLWKDIEDTIKKEGMNPDVFIKGGHIFLGDPVDVLYRLQNGKIANYDMFIAEFEDIVEHYDLIVEGDIL